MYSRHGSVASEDSNERDLHTMSRLSYTSKVMRTVNSGGVIYGRVDGVRQ
jgi:hypothetical protein